MNVTKNRANNTAVITPVSLLALSCQVKLCSSEQTYIKKRMTAPHTADKIPQMIVMTIRTAVAIGFMGLGF